MPSQHDYNLANADGATFRADLNNALVAGVENNSGATAPSTTFAYMWWADTTVNVLKQRNSANTAWIIRAPLVAAGVLAKAIDYTVLIDDVFKTITVDAGAANRTMTLPAAAIAGDGFEITFKAQDVTNTITIDGNSAETIDGATTITLDNIEDAVTLICDGSNWRRKAQFIATSPSQATQAALEGETNEATYARPDRIKHSPGVAKVWVKFDGTAAGPITPDADHNVTDITDNGTCDYTVNFTDNFSTADFAASCISNAADMIMKAVTYAVGFVNVQGGQVGVTTIDASIVSVECFGDQ